MAFNISLQEANIVSAWHTNSVFSCNQEPMHVIMFYIICPKNHEFNDNVSRYIMSMGSIRQILCPNESDLQSTKQSKCAIFFNTSL